MAMKSDLMSGAIPHWQPSYDSKQVRPESGVVVLRLVSVSTTLSMIGIMSLALRHFNWVSSARYWTGADSEFLIETNQDLANNVITQ